MPNNQSFLLIKNCQYAQNMSQPGTLRVSLKIMIVQCNSWKPKCFPSLVVWLHSKQHLTMVWQALRITCEC